MTLDTLEQSSNTRQSKKKRSLSKWEQLDLSKNTTKLGGTAVEVFVEEELKEHLRYNILTNEFELNGKPFNINICQSEIYELYNVDCSKARLTDAITKWCLRNEFNPIKDYLISNAARVKPLKIISNLASRYFGNEDLLDNILLMKWLLATAIRGLYPGTKFDGALILTGVKDAGKTSFFQEISKGWYTADVTHISGDKDMSLLASGKWIVLLDEIEKIIRKGNRQDIKSWVTKTRDDFRVPYDRTPQSFPRMFTIAGTCNDDDFLTEAEDNRRFWIIQIENKTRFDVLIPEIDAMWSACVKYINEHLEQNSKLDPQEALRQLCELSDLEKQQLKNRSKRFAMTTGWDDVVEEFISNNPRDYYWHTEIEEYAKAKNIVPAGSYPHQKIKDALRRLSYEQHKNPVARDYKGHKSKKRWWHLPQGLSPSSNVSDKYYEECLEEIEGAILSVQEFSTKEELDKFFNEGKEKPEQ